MNTWIHQVLSNEHATITVLIAVFLMGMISVVTCGCNFAILGVVAGYSGASSSTDKSKTVWLRGISFLLGGIISMAAIGGLSTACNTCYNPFFSVILTASFVKGSALWGLIMLAAFACGYGLPMAAAIVGFGLGLGKISKTVSLISTIVKYIGGITLVALGFYLLISI